MMVSTNLQKYQSKNPLVRFLNNRLVSTVCELALTPKPKKVLDAGCGEGFVINKLMTLKKEIDVTGLDIEKDALEYARNINPGVNFIEGSVYKLPFENEQFDLVICSEVLEHLEHPDKAMAEISRITKGHCVISVPNEPIWRIGNMARLAYLSNFGNTPGHINHWTKRKFLDLISKVFEVKKVKTPLPWVAALCKKK